MPLESTHFFMILRMSKQIPMLFKCIEIKFKLKYTVPTIQSKTQ